MKPIQNRKTAPKVKIGAVQKKNNLAIKISRMIIQWILIGGFLNACGGGSGGGGNSSSSAVSNQQPLGFSIQAIRINKHSIEIAWPNSTDPDNDPLNYRINTNNQIVRENMSEKFITIDNLQPDTNYDLKVDAIDPKGLINSSRLILRTRQEGELSLHSTSVNAVSRHYVVFKPENSENKKLPLVIWFHGAGYMLPSNILQDYWIELAQREQFYLLAPVAISDQYESFTYWNAGLGSRKDDVLLTSTAMDNLIAQEEIDVNRIYVAGMSSGGHMAFYTALRLQDRIAAVAPIAGSITKFTLYPEVTAPGVFDSYQIPKPMPICHIHGNADGIVNIMGGSWYVSWEDIRTRWINSNKANPTPQIISLPDINQNDGSTVTKYEYRGNTPASDIDDYLIRSGNHSIPGIEAEANQDINSYEVIWKFFKQHSLTDPY